MDLWQMIVADHVNLEELCREVLEAMGSGPLSRARLFAELDRELERHIRAKERVVYPALARESRTKEYVAELQQEHEEIRRRMGELAARPDKNSRAWATEFRQLVSSIRHCFSMERNGVLTVARGAVAPHEAQSLRRAFEREKIASLQARRWHVPEAMIPGRYGLSAGAVFGALGGILAVGAAAVAWRKSQHGSSRPMRPVERRPEPPFPLRGRTASLDQGSRGDYLNRGSAMRDFAHEAGREPHAPMPADETGSSPESWFSSANPPRAPSGLATDLQPGGLAPGGGPGASVGSIGTGGAQTGNRDSGSLKRDGR